MQRATIMYCISGDVCISALVGLSFVKPLAITTTINTTNPEFQAISWYVYYHYQLLLITPLPPLGRGKDAITKHSVNPVAVSSKGGRGNTSSPACVMPIGGGGDSAIEEEGR